MASKDILGLAPGTSYVVQIQAVGSDQTQLSDWSTVYTFVTPGNPAGTTNTANSMQLGRGATLFAGNPPGGSLVAAEKPAAGNSGLIVSDNSFTALKADGATALFRISVPNDSIEINAAGLTLTSGGALGTSLSMPAGSASFQSLYTSGSFYSPVQNNLGGNTYISGTLNMSGATTILGSAYFSGSIYNGIVTIDSTGVSAYTSIGSGSTSTNFGPWTGSNPGNNTFLSGNNAVGNGSTITVDFGTTAPTGWTTAAAGGTATLSTFVNTSGTDLNGTYTITGIGTRNDYATDGITLYTTYFLTVSSTKVGTSYSGGSVSGTYTTGGGGGSGGYVKLGSSGLQFSTGAYISAAGSYMVATGTTYNAASIKNISIDSGGSSATPSGGSSGDIAFYTA